MPKPLTEEHINRVVAALEEGRVVGVLSVIRQLRAERDAARKQVRKLRTLLESRIRYGPKTGHPHWDYCTNLLRDQWPDPYCDYLAEAFAASDQEGETRNA